METLSRRNFLQKSALGITACTLPALLSRCSTRQRPNVVWLISEDTSPDLHCYGNPLVKTPNLDTLAAEGTMFTNAFATCPVCSPARSAMMTGMYQTTIGAHQHRTTAKKTLPEPVKIIMHYFREQGYFVTNCAGPNYKKKGKTDWNFIPGEQAFDGTDWDDRQPGQPFFAQLNFHYTHRTFKRDPDHPIDPEKVEIPPYYPDHALTRRDWADYLESLQLLDKQIGQVVERLKNEGELDNTILVYTGDHGRPHVRGKQWLYEGGIRVPLIIRWPGHIKAGAVSDDLVSSIDLAPTCMALAGLTPPAHWQGQIFLGTGKSSRDVIFAARDRCDGTPDRIRCVRTKQYKYIRNYHPERPYMQFNGYKKHQYPVLTLLQILHKQKKLTPAQKLFMAPVRPGEELYDLNNDPDEIHNRVDDPACQVILNELRNTLDTWIDDTGDKGEIPEDPAAEQVEVERMYENFKKRMAARGLSPDISDEDYLKWWESKLLGQTE